MNNVNDIISERIKKDETIFFILRKIVQECGHLNIISRKNLYGLAKSNDVNAILLPTIFDEIKMLYSEIWAVRLNYLWGVFNLSIDKWAFLPCCNDLVFNEYYKTIEMISDFGHGLYSIINNRILIPMKYDDVTICDNCDYLWVKQGTNYHFIRQRDGKFISVVDATFAFDTFKGMFIKYKDQITCVNEDGLDLPMSLRCFVSKGNGRGRVINIKHHENVIFDIYGVILND